MLRTETAFLQNQLNQKTTSSKIVILDMKITILENSQMLAKKSYSIKEHQFGG